MDAPDATRRRLIAAVPATLAAAPALAADPAPAAPNRPQDADVLIVGAGIAGLVAARRLVQAGRSVIVVEARDRVGGRTWSVEVEPGLIAELGGTWVGPTQDRILALVAELGLDVFDQYTAGESVYLAGDARKTFRDAPPLGAVPPDPLILPDLAVASAWMDRVAAGIPVGAPWTAPDAEALDRQTFESWLRTRTLNLLGRTAQNFSAGFEAMFGAEARELSALFALHYVAAAGNERTPGSLECLLNTRGGAQEKKIVQGAQSVCRRMAEALGTGRVRLSSPVRRIVQDDGGVRALGEGFELRGRQLIVAVPPALAGRIEYQPALPALRDQLTQRFAMGWLVKCIATYDTPFWREAGLNGSAVITQGPARSIFDVSPQAGGRGALLGFVGGDAARAHANDPEGLRAAVIDNFAACFGDQARAVRGWYVADWGADPWTRGCPTGIAPPGLLSAYGPALVQPVGRIHWSGTETAGYWTGYMDGAVRAGERAAQEVLAS